jgi:predicted nuclease of predicted toxin-antitoxin system
VPRFLLDEHINPAVAIQLRRKGYDAASIHETEHLGLHDPEVLELAAAQRRSLVTYNIVDFEALAGQWFARGLGHSGIVLVHERTIPQRTVGKLVRALAALAVRFPGPRALDDQVIYLTREP